MTTNPTITQADREAAASLAEWLRENELEWKDRAPWFLPAPPNRVREGWWDNHDWVQSFARHREQAVAEKDARIAELEAENARLREHIASHGPCMPVSPYAIKPGSGGISTRQPKEQDDGE